MHSKQPVGQVPCLAFKFGWLFKFELCNSYSTRRSGNCLLPGLWCLLGCGLLHRSKGYMPSTNYFIDHVLYSLRSVKRRTGDLVVQVLIAQVRWWNRGISHTDAAIEKAQQKTKLDSQNQLKGLFNLTLKLKP